MDPVTLIVAALAAGALKGVGESASDAVADSYRGLKELVSHHLSGIPGAEPVLARHEQDPGAWEKPLELELRNSGAERDEALIAVARKLLELTDSPGATAGKYVVDARGATIGAIGDHTTQTNYFGTPPGAH
jgi:hypothetical protein